MLHDPKTVSVSDFDQETAEKIAPQFIARLELANCIRNVKCPLWQIFCSSKNLGQIILLPCLVVEGTILILKDDYVFGAVAVIDVIAVHVDVCLSC